MEKWRLGRRVAHRETAAEGEIDSNGPLQQLHAFDGGDGPWVHVQFDDGLSCWVPTAQLIPDMWLDDSIQFPRLIAELEEIGGFGDPDKVRELRESMDIEPHQLDDLVNRARAAWDRIKEET